MTVATHELVHTLPASALKEALTRRAHEVEAALDRLLPVPPGPESRVVEAMRYAVLNGGKRLRAFLVLESAALFDGVAADSGVRAAASVEMLHAYSLVHDDLPAMDDDDLRRGKPSAHRAFDEATAILAGDALQTSAFELLADAATHPDPAARCALVLALARAVGADGMVGGQMIDMASEGRALTTEQVGRLHALKTGRLIQYSAEAGGILGAATPAQQEALASYGRDLGAAFQIVDDILDTEGTAEELGKTAGKDEAAGKATFVAVLGIDGAKHEAQALADRAKAALSVFGGRAAMLTALVDYVLARRS
ncbi:Geranyltranstransferase [Granulibacter bethesdensis]|uniref:polyprenyl synthetase family protein n=1 Tax=Granulibacter bethesdensis TaxID=364410 RepID=UPI00090CAC02|nr:farnesyl diphosphate synthase [Granulibacter bethesdensis]APH56003.1 Geranyltranstransferase [Granulibacter bethesdensis]